MMKFCKIDRIEEVPHNSKVYDISLDKDHYFSANGIISHNCRLRSDTSKLYLNTLGGSSTKVGSLGVVTINLPHVAHKNSDSVYSFIDRVKYLTEITGLINNSKRNIIRKRIKDGFLPAYTYNFMSIKLQYSTTGINGLYEAAKYLGYSVLTEEGLEFTKTVLKEINEVIDQMDSKYGFFHNVEQVPAESVAVKLAKKDKIYGMDFDTDFYSNQFVPLVENCNMLDRMSIQGELDQYFSGGSILHLNVGERLTSPDMQRDLILNCIRKGVVYHAINYVYNICDDGHVSIGNYELCPTCDKELEKFMRVVGFQTRVSDWSRERRNKDFPNRQMYYNGALKVASEKSL